MISLLTEHTRKCLNFEYLGRIKYDFQKSRVTGSWDHKDLVSAKKVFKKIHACVPLNLCKNFGHFFQKCRLQTNKEKYDWKMI
jgi:hypothetical protein